MQSLTDIELTKVYVNGDLNTGHLKTKHLLSDFLKARPFKYWTVQIVSYLCILGPGTGMVM